MRVSILVLTTIFISFCSSQIVSAANQINKVGPTSCKNSGTDSVHGQPDIYSEDPGDNVNSINREKSQDETSSSELEKRTSKVRKILAVFPYQGKSHHMFLQKVVKIILEMGHHVTLFTSYPMQEKFTNFKETLLTPTIASWADIFEFERMTTQTSWEARVDLEKLSESFMFPLYKSEEFQRLLRSEEQFDLVLLEPFFMQEPLVFLGHRFKCPVIALATAITETNQDLYMGRTKNPAVETEWTTCATKPNMNFYQRATNTFVWLVNMLETRFYYLPKREADFFSMVSYPGMESLPPLREMVKKVDVTFSNSHQLVEYPVAIPPNHVMLPGLHISNDVSLPQELKSLMDSSKEGVILFAMGTMVPVSKMKWEKEIFIKAFSKVRQLVLWKSDIDLPNLPDNIRTFKWLPQQAILAHKNCLAFVTHGGMLSKQEAVYFGVPLVSVPLFGDQLHNTGHSQATGLGLTLLYNNITVENLRSAINTVIYDEQYSKRMAKNSRIFREAVAQSKDKLRYWFNHVIDHEGAAYLRRDELQLNWIQFYLLDVVATFILIIVAVVIILLKCGQGLCRLRFPSKNFQDSKKKTN